MHWFGFRGVELTVSHAGPCAHVLNVAWLYHRTVAHAVAVLQRAFEHVGDDFHVAVGMHRESASSGDAVVIHHAQGAKVHVFWVVVIGKRKGEMGVQPAMVGVAAFVAFENLDHGGSLLGTSLSGPHYIRYNDYCQEVDLVAIGCLPPAAQPLESTNFAQLAFGPGFRPAR